jgi:hypothetical protein
MGPIEQYPPLVASLHHVHVPSRLALELLVGFDRHYAASVSGSISATSVPRSLATVRASIGLLLEMQTFYMGHARGAMGMTGLYKHHAPSDEELESDRKVLMTFLRRERQRASHLWIA